MNNFGWPTTGVAVAAQSQSSMASSGYVLRATLVSLLSPEKIERGGHDGDQ
jgi:hypothetical protein